MRIIKFVDYYCKLVLTEIIKLVFIFPVKKKLFLFVSFDGKQYSCNPKYLSEAICKTEFFKDVKIVWAFREPGNFNYLQRKGIKLVKYKSIKYIYYRLFSSVYITNIGEMPTLPTRSNQLYINTWHGGGAYKLCGVRNAIKYHDQYYVKKMRNSFSRATFFLSTCELASKEIFKESFLFRNKILEFGQPRNDIFFKTDNQKDIIDRVHKAFGIEADTKICLYAPTYREIGQLFDSHLDYQELKKCLKERFGGSWVVLYRSHQFLDNKEIKDNVISATNYPDMQELLVASDFFISDYSSSIWDYSFTYKPCLLFVPDLDKYVHDRDFYRPIVSWGFPMAKSNMEVQNLIKTFNMEEYRNNMIAHHNSYGSFEKGNATEKTLELIMQHISHIS